MTGESRSRSRQKSPMVGQEVSLAEPLLDCPAAAALLNVRVSWVRDAARLGQLPCLRVGRHLRFMRAMLEEWLDGQLAGHSQSGRAYSGSSGTASREVRRVALRPRTEAALLASLAEKPNSKPEKEVS
jgi:excisionase family DNA binding protein